MESGTGSLTRRAPGRAADHPPQAAGCRRRSVVHCAPDTAEPLLTIRYPLPARTMSAADPLIARGRRVLATEAQADEWFGILPKEDQFAELGVWKHRRRRKPRGK